MRPNEQTFWITAAVLGWGLLTIVSAVSNFVTV